MKTKIMAHRGASAYAPENSLEAFALAIEMGAHGIELDIYETADGGLVIHHDNNIKRMSGVDAKISETDFATLRTYNFAGDKGEKYGFVKIPEFREVLELFKPTDMTINVEMKEGSESYIRDIAALVKDFGMEEQVIYSSFDHFKLLRVRDYNPRAYTGALYSFNMACPWDYAKAAGFEALHPSYDQLYKFKNEFGVDYVAEAHKLGIEVNAWTANKPGIIADLVSWGVDNIITDVPDIALEKVRENG
jgi:glycerophosphoryl diester phosphodiesterase